MLRDLLSAGDKIDISIVDHNGRKVQKARSYVSQFVEFVEDDIIHIMTPIVAGKTITMDTGKTFHLLFYTDKGLYQCNCVVLRNFRENKVMMCAMRIVTDPKKYQRRQYYRLDLMQGIEYRQITSEEETLRKMLTTGSYSNEQEREEIITLLSRYDNEWIHATITDISGGGAKFNSYNQHQVEDKLRIRLDFIYEGEIDKPALNAKVVSSNLLPSRNSLYEHRVEFIHIMQWEREAIIKYIFEQERKRRKLDLF